MSFFPLLSSGAPSLRGPPTSDPLLPSPGPKMLKTKIWNCLKWNSTLSTFWELAQSSSRPLSHPTLYVGAVFLVEQPPAKCLVGLNKCDFTPHDILAFFFGAQPNFSSGFTRFIGQEAQKKPLVTFWFFLAPPSSLAIYLPKSQSHSHCY